MSNVRRLCETGKIFFVCVNLRRTIKSFDATEYAALIGVLKASRRRLGFALCGYVLMPDHWHALISTEPPLTISQVLHDVKKMMALRVHALRGTTGPLWQHQFWDRFVRHAMELGERLDSMHLNPVRKGLVNRPEDWRWSSYNNDALEKSTLGACPIQIDYLQLSPAYRA